MKRILKDKDGLPIEFDINGQDLLNPLEYLAKGWTGGMDSRSHRINKKRWRTQKAVGDHPYMKKQGLRKD